MEVGERMLIWCVGGPAPGRAVTFPPPPEIELDDGMYVLVDDGPPNSGATSSRPILAPGTVTTRRS